MQHITASHLGTKNLNRCVFRQKDGTYTSMSVSQFKRAKAASLVRNLGPLATTRSDEA